MLRSEVIVRRCVAQLVPKEEVGHHTTDKRRPPDRPVVVTDLRFQYFLLPVPVNEGRDVVAGKLHGTRCVSDTDTRDLVRLFIVSAGPYFNLDDKHAHPCLLSHNTSREPGTRTQKPRFLGS